MTKVELCDGKYTVVDELFTGGGFYALRHGEKWRSLAGDKLVYSMFCEIEELRKENKRLRATIAEEVTCIGCGDECGEDWAYAEGTPVCRVCFDYGWR